MRILLASSEAVPFSKTGGLADVSTALAKALADAGHQVWLAVPYYPQVYPREPGRTPELRPMDLTVDVRVGGTPVLGRLWWAELPGSNVTVLLIDNADFFDRASLYQENGSDYKDNCQRFVFFSRAVMETARQLLLRPNVIHANDWQTGLIPALLEAEYRTDPAFEGTGSVFTIHNLAFQGQFWHWDMLLTGLDWKYFNWRQMESYGQLNLLKTGITFADLVTTVSPTYAREIQTPEFGCGLEGVLQFRRDDLVGILNGVDTDVWNPATDPHLPRNYDANSVDEGKAACKAHLQQRQGLPVRGDVPLFGMISRMTDQKGFDLISGCIEQLLERDLQMVFLGTGEPRYEQLMTGLRGRFADKLSVTVGFDEALAHQIEAGADAYLMPSLFEPCGLNQMYSLIYGTVPVVRAVGGLADTVIDASAENLAAGTATGFRFPSYNQTALAEQVQRAAQTFHDQPTWRQLVQNGMRSDFSWGQSAQQYLAVYERACARRVAVRA